MKRTWKTGPVTIRDDKVIGPYNTFVSGQFYSWEQLQEGSFPLDVSQLPGVGFFIAFDNAEDAQNLRLDAQVIALNRVLTEEEKQQIEAAKKVGEKKNASKKRNSKSVCAPRKKGSRAVKGKSKTSRTKSKPVSSSSNKKRGR